MPYLVWNFHRDGEISRGAWEIKKTLLNPRHPDFAEVMPWLVNLLVAL
jgi:hypothetical protein